MNTFKKFFMASGVLVGFLMSFPAEAQSTGDVTCSAANLQIVARSNGGAWMGSVKCLNPVFNEAEITKADEHLFKVLIVAKSKNWPVKLSYYTEGYQQKLSAVTLPTGN